MKYTDRGKADGDGCNCLIDTLSQLIAPDACVKTIRVILMHRFQDGPDRVIEDNYLTFETHWRDIVVLLDKDPDDFKITCVDLDFQGNGEVVGGLDEDEIWERGVDTLYVARENRNHFIPLFKKKFFGGL